MFISLCASRFNVELDKETSTFILRIRDIQETDGATYQCQVMIEMVEKEVILPCNAQDHGIMGL